MFTSEEMKKFYIQENLTRNITLDKVVTPKFNKCKPFEKQYGKDLCCFNAQEIVEMYKSFFMSSYDMLALTHSHFKLYTEWCVSKGYTNINHFIEIYPETLQSCLNLKALCDMICDDRNRLLYEINKLSNPSDKFLVLAIFEGVCGKGYTDLNIITADHVCEKRSMILDYCVSQELVYLALESAKEYYYYTLEGRRVPYKQDDPRVIKDLYNVFSTSEKVASQRIRMKLQRIQILFDGCPLYTRAGLTESGRMYRNKMLMKDGYTLEEALRETNKIYSVAPYSQYVLKYGRFYK